MNFYILNISSVKKIHFISAFKYKENDLFLFYDRTGQKIYGLYKIKTRRQVNDLYEYLFDFYKIYRRGINIRLLTAYNLLLTFKNKDHMKLSKRIFNTIIKKLQLINFPQLSADQLFISRKGNQIEMIYIQNYPEVKFMLHHVKLRPDILNALGLIIKKNIQQILHNPVKDPCLSEINERIYKVFFSNCRFIDLFSDRFINLVIQPDLARIPFESMLYSLNKNIFFSRLLPVNQISSDSAPVFNKTINDKNINLFFPRYSRLAMDHQQEIQYLKKELSENNPGIYNKNFTRTEFMGYIEDSYIFYFSGHTVYNKKHQEYGLKINDNNVFYLSDFLNCLQMPKLIILNSCFDFNYIHQLDRQISLLLEAGCKNVIVPFSNIWQEQDAYFPLFFKLLNSGRNISDIFPHIQNRNTNLYKYLILFFRIYGNALEKYF